MFTVNFRGTYGDSWVPSVHTQLCSTLCSSVDYSPPGSSVHGIGQTRILEWVAISSSRGFSQLRDQTQVSWLSCIGRRILHHRATRGTQHVPRYPLNQILPPVSQSVQSLPPEWYVFSNQCSYSVITQSLQYTLGFVLVAIHMFGQMHNNMYPPF